MAPRRGEAVIHRFVGGEKAPKNRRLILRDNLFWTLALWLSLCGVLEAAGMEVVMVDGRQTSNLPGRKTDMKDCQWGATLHAHALLRAGKSSPIQPPSSDSMFMERILIRGLALALLVAPNLLRAESAIVRSGVKSQIALHMALSSRTCQGYRIVIEILAAPRNGTLTTEPKNRVIPPVTSRGGQQPSQCVGKTAAGLAIFYQSKPGFVGQDSLNYRRSSPDDPRDPNAGDISYTVIVK